MKAKEVMKLLHISKGTLYNYVKDNLITYTKINDYHYDYHEDSVFKLLKKDTRLNVIYCRVSTNKQKNDLKNQVDELKLYCKNNNIIVGDVISEISFGIDLDRPLFNKLIDDVIAMKIAAIYISHKDRLTRLSFKTLQFIFSKFGTKIIVINDDANKSNDVEIFEELLSLLHIFSTTMYSHRRKKKIDIVKDDLENFLMQD